MKGVEYHQAAFEKKFYWLDHKLMQNIEGPGVVKYESLLTQVAWEGWCSALEHAFKLAKEKHKS
jgi:hypothetical protein